MANYKLVDADQLDADMTAVAESIRTKGGTTEQLPWPDGFKAAVEAISTGVEVQKKSGSFKTNSNGSATVSNLGFKPDLVSIDGHSAPFETSNTDRCSISISPANASSYLLTEVTVTRTSGGFSVTAKNLDFSFAETNCTNRTLNYIAVKYT